MSVHNDLLNDEKYVLDKLNNETSELPQMCSFWEDELEDTCSSWQDDTLLVCGLDVTERYQ